MFPVRAFRSSAPVMRQVAQRRFASGGSNFQGAADNAFNRERAAVKEHAAESSGTWRQICS
jgi:cytochrome c oxidase subunit 6a